MWPTVAVTDVESRWRPMTDAEKVVATARIADAETELKLRLRDVGVEAPIADDDLWAALYKRTVADAVRRYMLNPEGWASESESGDDYSYTNRRDASIASGTIYVTDDEVTRLLPLGRRKRGAFTIVPGYS